MFMHLRKRIELFLFLGLAAVLLASPLGGTAYGAAPLKKAPSQDSINFLKTLSQSLADVAEVAWPSVVNISTTSTVTAEESPFGDMFNDPFFRRFFGDQYDQQGPKRKFKSASLGSGVIVSDNGYILTSNHVVKGAEDIRVIVYDKREFKGKIVGTDPRTDLAVIKINATDLPAAKIGESSKLKAGDVVLAIGAPFGLTQSITMGIVSAVGRSNVGIADLEDFIQTDAAINPGNSGGALVNTNGEVIGINTAIFSTSGGYMGIGFAVPSDMAKTVMDSIIKYGKVIRGWLGVSIQDLTQELAKSLNIKQRNGALVADVVKDSPAEKAGLKRGDVVIEYDKKPVQDSTTLRNMVASTAPGKTVTMKIVRNGKEQEVSVTLSEYKERKKVKKVEYNNVLKGITVQELTPSVKDKLGLPQTISGVVITDIAPESPAQGVLQPGDLILEVNRKEISGLSDYDRTASKIGPKDTVLLLVLREGGTVYITLRPQG
jgi:serine protease Do